MPKKINCYDSKLSGSVLKIKNADDYGCRIQLNHASFFLTICNFNFRSLCGRTYAHPLLPVWIEAKKAIFRRQFASKTDNVAKASDCEVSADQILIAPC
jgi:hypothetical protein